MLITETAHCPASILSLCDSCSITVVPQKHVPQTLSCDVMSTDSDGCLRQSTGFGRAQFVRIFLILQIRLNDPSQYQSIVDAEWKIIYDKLDRCVESGAKVVLSRLAIGDLGTQYFADRDIFCAGRVRAPH